SCTYQRPQTFTPTVQLSLPLKDIRHACTENAPPTLCVTSILVPDERFIPMVIRKETALRMVAPNLMSHAFCPKLRIAVLASGGNLGTTPPRVESMISPFDRRILPHISEEQRASKIG